MRLLERGPYTLIPVRDTPDGGVERPVERVPGCIVTGASGGALNLRVPRERAEEFATIDRRIRDTTRCAFGPWDPIGPRLRAFADSETRFSDEDGGATTIGECLPRVCGDRTVCRNATAVVQMDPILKFANQYTWRLLAIELER